MPTTRAGALVGLGLAVAGSLLLLVADGLWFDTATTGGPALSALYVGGAVLLLWAAITTVVLAAVLIRRVLGRRTRPGALEAFLIGATACVIVAVLLVGSLVGSGGAAAPA